MDDDDNEEEEEGHDVDLVNYTNYFNSSESVNYDRGVDLRIENEIAEMYKAKSLDTALLLRWCKLLEYDFFRIYTQHIILYAPSGNYNTILNENVSRLPKFKKNIYTREVIDFILERIVKGEMTRLQVINEYKIPKTTLYKWIEKYAV